MRRFRVLLAALVLIVIMVFAIGATAQSSTYVVAFNQSSGLPANVDQLVASAGGTISIRLPEIGGIGVVSSNPNFAAQIAQNPSVKSADVATATQLIDPVLEPSVTSSTNNGGNFSNTGSDSQPMPDPLGFEQWDKKKMNASSTGS